ncbi:MAG: AraC family transcriptional regulator [Fulvivirga sp.]|uniref:helix-turn-helix domain-containing protein n=1 Tax=Fulvivirga sp. TaxID=1931237 RepID=UPI0032ED519E
MNNGHKPFNSFNQTTITHFKGYELNGIIKKKNCALLILNQGAINLEFSSLQKIEYLTRQEFIIISPAQLVQIKTVMPSKGVFIEFCTENKFSGLDFMMEIKIPITSGYYSNLCFDEVSTLHVNLISEAIMNYIHQLHDWGNAIHYSKKNTKKDVLTKLLKARVIIENEYQKQIDVQYLANSVAMSKFNFIRKFKEAFGFTPQQYILQKRISFSQLKLRSNKTLSITDLANLSGFQNIYHFSKTFKKMVGISPSYYQIST